jgi:hypothetical protein
MYKSRHAADHGGVAVIGCVGLFSLLVPSIRRFLPAQERA